MDWKRKLANRTRQAGNNICVGLDPILGKISGVGSSAARIRAFYLSMLEAMVKRGILPAVVKPNIAYFEAEGIEALEVLIELISTYQAAGIPVILDAKRADISSTSAAYARSAFEVFGADAVTVSPYLGWDGVKPFMDYDSGRGVYVLVRTSNPSARDFQELMTHTADGNFPLYRRVAEKLVEWDRGNAGAVVGATAPAELEELLAYWKSRGIDIPLLIPGVPVSGVAGGQAGSMAEVVNAIRRSGSDFSLHLVNSSSGINYAFEKFPGVSPADASAQALEELAAEWDAHCKAGT